MRPCTRRSRKPTDALGIPGARGRGHGLDLTASVGNRSSTDACFFSALLSGRQSFGGLPSPSPIGRDVWQEETGDTSESGTGTRTRPAGAWEEPARRRTAAPVPVTTNQRHWEGPESGRRIGGCRPPTRASPGLEIWGDTVGQFHAMRSAYLDACMSGLESQSILGIGKHSMNDI